MTGTTDDAAIRQLVIGSPGPVWADSIPELMEAVKKRSGAPGSLAEIRAALWRAGYVPDCQREGGKYFLAFPEGPFQGVES